MVSGEDPTTLGAAAEAEMDPDFSRGDGFGFAFNSLKFSDRVLRIEVVASDSLPGSSGDVFDGSLAESARPRKRCRVEQCAVKGDEGQSIDPSTTMVGTPVLRVKTVHISSVILAAKSPFFFKLFSNGMKESYQSHLTLRITDSEENALMEVLSFMYSGKLTTTDPSLLLDILMVADKFEVVSCMRHCSQLLTMLPMTTESALLYLDHPCSVSMVAEVQPVTNAAKKFLADKYRELFRFKGEVMSMPLSGIEAIFSSNDLQVLHEDDVYDFLIKWARAQYPSSEERREVLSSRVLPLVRFSHMTCQKLREVLTCTDIDHEQATNYVMEALLYKADAPHKQRALAADAITGWRFAERAYKFRLLKVVEYHRPYPHFIAYFDLKREECSRLFPSGSTYSHSFNDSGLGVFILIAQCSMQQNSMYSFGLSLGIIERRSLAVIVDFEFAVKTRPSGEFVTKFNDKFSFTGGRKISGCRNVFGIPWSEFMSDDSPFFIDGMLHLRAEFTMKQTRLMN